MSSGAHADEWMRSVDGIADRVAQIFRSELQFQPSIELTRDPLGLVRPRAERQSGQRLFDLTVRGELARRARFGEYGQFDGRASRARTGRRDRDHECEAPAVDGAGHHNETDPA